MQMTQLSLTLDGSEKSFLEALKAIERFGNISGLMVNNSKTEALWTGADVENDFKLRPEKDFKWLRKKVKALRECSSQHTLIWLCL